jgi:hypothetical protein
MKTNPILKEIRDTREKLAVETGMDLRRLFALVKQQEQAARARGEVLIPEPSRVVVVREDKAVYGDTPENQAL